MWKSAFENIDIRGLLIPLLLFFCAVFCVLFTACAKAPIAVTVCSRTTVIVA